MIENDRLIGLDYEFSNFNKVNYEDQRVVYGRYLPLLDDCAFMLDLGCGKGDFQRLMAERGKVCIGVDSDPKMCEAAREKGLQVECRDVLEYLREQPEGRFDCIFAAHLVEHLPFQAVIELVDNSMRALKPGGILLLTTPNVRSLWPHLEDFYLHFGHIRFYHPRCLQFFMENSGLADVETGENEVLKGHLFGGQENLLNGVKDISAVFRQGNPVEGYSRERTALEELVRRNHLPDGLSGLSFKKRLKWKLRLGVARLIAPFFDEIRMDLSVQRYNFGRLTEQVDAHQDVLSDIIARLDSPTEAFAKGVKPKATGGPMKTNGL